MASNKNRPAKAQACGRVRHVRRAWAFGCTGAPPRRSPETESPRANQPPYPVILGASDERREQALSRWTTLLSDQGIANQPAPQLQPVTATLRELPALATPLRLPKVGGANGTAADRRRDARSVAPLHRKRGRTARHRATTRFRSSPSKICRAATNSRAINKSRFFIRCVAATACSKSRSRPTAA